MKGKYPLLVLLNIGFSASISIIVAAKLGVGEDLDRYFALTLFPSFFNVFSYAINRQVLVPLLRPISGLPAKFKYVLWLAALYALFSSVVGGMSFTYLSYSGNLTGNIFLSFYFFILLYLAVASPVITSMFISEGKLIINEAIVLVGNTLVFSLFILSSSDWLAQFAWSLLLLRYFPIFLGAGLILIFGKEALGRGAHGVESPIVNYLGKLKPVFFSNIYFKSDIFIDKLVASFLGEGALSVVSLSQQILSVYHTLISKVYMVKNLNFLTDLNGSNQSEGLVDQVNRFSSKILSINIRTYICILVFYYLYNGFFVGVYDLERYAVGQISLYVLIAGGSIVLAAPSQAYAQYYYARGDTYRPSVIGTVVYTCSLPLKITCCYLFGIWGLSLTLSLYAIMTYGVYRWNLYQR